jgi:iron complex outermembrane receptor protein
MRHYSLLFVTLLYVMFGLSVGTLTSLAQQEQPATKDTVFYLSPVIVTATHARERETPVTFSDIDAQKIRERYTAQDAPALLSELPSILHYSWNGNDIGYTFLNLRGFEQRRISVMINGVPQNDPEDHQVYWIDMPDLLAYTNNIQIQRGAGSAFYGPPAIGGSINIETTPVTTHPKISLSSGWGFQEFGGEGRTVLNTRKYALALSSGLLGNRYALFGNLSRIKSGGYREHSWVDLDSYFVGAARFDESMTTRVHLYGGPITDGLSYVGIPKYYNEEKTLRRANYSYWEFDPGSPQRIGFYVPQKPQAAESFFQPHYEILHEWRLSPRLTLYNTLFYIQGDGYFDYDGDWVWSDPTASNWFHSVVGYDSTFGTSKFPSLLLRGFVGNKQWGWLPRIELEHARGKLTLGGELRLHRSVHWGKIPFASEFPSASFDPDFRFYEYNGEKDIVSLYGHELYRIDDATTLMADLQFAYNEYGIHDEKFLGHDFDIPYFFVNPRLGINRNFSDRFSGYISVAYTSREPRLRNLYAAEDAWFGARPQFEATTTEGVVRYRFDQPYAKPENLLDLEVGSNCLFENGKASLNLYWMEFRDELIKSGKIDIFGAPVTGNAERTRHVGVEFTATYSLTPNLELSGNATFSLNKLINYRFYDEDRGDYRSLDGNPIAGFPDVLTNWRLSYRDGGFFGSLLMKYVGGFYTDNFKDEMNKIDGYAVFDFDGSYTLPSVLENTEIALALKVRNLFNTLYMASGEGKEFFPAAERNYFIGLTINL